MTDDAGGAASGEPMSSSTIDLVSELENLSLSNDDEIVYEQYRDESQLPEITALIAKDLSEPYNVYTYRYFLQCWPKLSWLALDAKTRMVVGVIINKVDSVEVGDQVEFKLL